MYLLNMRPGLASKPVVMSQIMLEGPPPKISSEEVHTFCVLCENNRVFFQTVRLQHSSVGIITKHIFGPEGNFKFVFTKALWVHSLPKGKVLWPFLSNDHNALPYLELPCSAFSIQHLHVASYCTAGICCCHVPV